MNRLGLLMAAGRNRELLMQALCARYDVGVVDAVAELTEVDLLIADVRALERALARAVAGGSRDSVPPPVLLLVRANERLAVPPHVSAAADEIVAMPVAQRDLVRRIIRLAEHGRRAAEERRAVQSHVAHINHELRTPLQAVLAFTELLADEGLDREQAQHVSRIATGGQRMLHLVNEMLDYSRSQAGHVELKFAPVDVMDAVATAAAVVQPLADRRALRLSVGRPPGPPPVVWADSVRLEQILINLLSNAVKYNRDGGWVEVRTHTNRPESVTVEVADSGPGIATEDLDRIFVPFERLATVANATGTGLGLPYARLLAERMGGRILVRSRLGGGSTFSLDLPHA